MTTRKIRGTALGATEEAIFGYRPGPSRSRMNSDDQPDDDELLTDGDPTYVESCVTRITIGELKRAIREVLVNQHLKS